MSLTRKFLKALGLEEDKVEEIITAHGETVTALKEQIEQYKADAEQLPAIKAELAKAKEGNGDSYKLKYEALKETHDKYVADIEGEKTTSKKQAAYKALLAECKISDDIQDTILELANAKGFDGIEFGEDGTIKEPDKLKSALTTKWAKHIVSITEKNAFVPTPPRSETSPLDALKKQYEDAEKRRDIVGMQAAQAQIRQIKKE
ncbi:MAG: hypothetical protein WC374_05820 [Phycisphaerae bacterium]|jgi:hypothetical protein